MAKSEKHGIEYKSRGDYIKKYNRINYDEFKIRLPKGYKERIKKHIGTRSINEFFKLAIDDALDKNE